MANSPKETVESPPIQDATTENPLSESSPQSPSRKSATSADGTHDSSLTPAQEQSEAQQQEDPQDNLSEPVKTLKDAFPSVEVEVIEAVLESQNGQMERAFEVLLSMSDPNYTPPVVPPQESTPTPPMPPRLTGNPLRQGYTHEPRSEQELISMDEAYARQLALEDQMLRSQQQQQQQRRQQQQQAQNNEPIFNFQEELPIIKERVIEAGNAAKKKVMDLYNQFKASRMANASPQEASMRTTNAQYCGLPGDDGDDLLTGDMSALHLSDNDVYARTTKEGTSPRRSGDHNRREQSYGAPAVVQGQIKADEELARRLAREDQLWETQARSPNPAQVVNSPRTMSPRTPPLPVQQKQEETDGESVTLTAPDTKSNIPTTTQKPRHEDDNRPYVISNEDDSDELVDIEQEKESKASKTK